MLRVLLLGDTAIFSLFIRNKATLRSQSSK